MNKPHSHEFRLRVYYEDTDLGGIVYYANYLKFIERGRSEWVRSVGVDQRQMADQEGLGFVVRRVEADYLAPAHFEDELTVVTKPLAVGGASLTLQQDVFRAEECLFSARVVLVCLKFGGGVTRLPAKLRSNLPELS